MPRYFYHLKQDGEWQFDPEGLPFENVGEVKKELLIALGELVKERLARERLDEIAIEVSDEDGEALMRASVKVDFSGAK